MPKISVLPTAGALTGNEFLALVQNNVTVKSLLTTVSAYIMAQGATPTGAAAGDLTGTYPNPGVGKIRGRTISSAAPSDQQVLTWVAANNDWEPQSPAAGGVSSLADATNGGLNFSASTGAITASLKPSDLLTKSAPTTSDSFMMMDAAASNAAKTSTGTQATAALALMVGDSGSGGTKGLVPAPAAGDAAAGKFLKADATWAVASAGAGTVNQAALKSTNGTVTVSSGSGSITGQILTLPGGAYGFYPQLKTDAAATTALYATLVADVTVQTAASAPFQIGNGVGGLQGTTLLAAINLANNNQNAGTHAVTAQQQYIQASPPYNLGDGDVQGFFFALLERGTGTVLSTYAAPEAPWIYNGPTVVVPDLVDAEGRKFRWVTIRDVTLAQVQSGQSTLKQYLDCETQAGWVQITQALYHADMNLVPHPFLSADPAQHVVVLLDPMHDLIGRLLAEQEEGADINSLIYDGHLKFDNEPLARTGPSCVMQVAIRL